MARPQLTGEAAVGFGMWASGAVTHGGVAAGFYTPVQPAPELGCLGQGQ